MLNATNSITDQAMIAVQFQSNGVLTGAGRFIGICIDGLIGRMTRFHSLGFSPISFSVYEDPALCSSGGLIMTLFSCIVLYLSIVYYISGRQGVEPCAVTLSGFNQPFLALQSQIIRARRVCHPAS